MKPKGRKPTPKKQVKKAVRKVQRAIHKKKQIVGHTHTPLFTAKKAVLKIGNTTIAYANDVHYSVEGKVLEKEDWERYLAIHHVMPKKSDPQIPIWELVRKDTGLILSRHMNRKIALEAARAWMRQIDKILLT